MQYKKFQCSNLVKMKSDLCSSFRLARRRERWCQVRGDNIPVHYFGNTTSCFVLGTPIVVVVGKLPCSVCHAQVTPKLHSTVNLIIHTNIALAGVQILLPDAQVPFLVMHTRTIEEQNPQSSSSVLLIRRVRIGLLPTELFTISLKFSGGKTIAFSPTLLDPSHRLQASIQRHNYLI